MDDWQPIETAPKDGTRILIVNPAENDSVCIAWWDDDRYAKNPRPYWTSDSYTGRRAERASQPTLWQPVPPLPALPLPAPTGQSEALEEAVARALCDRRTWPGAWERSSNEVERSAWREDARAALAAIRKAKG